MTLLPCWRKLLFLIFLTKMLLKIVSYFIFQIIKTNSAFFRLAKRKIFPAILMKIDFLIKKDVINVSISISFSWSLVRNLLLIYIHIYILYLTLTEQIHVIVNPLQFSQLKILLWSQNVIFILSQKVSNKIKCIQKVSWRLSYT